MSFPTLETASPHSRLSAAGEMEFLASPAWSSFDAPDIALLLREISTLSQDSCKQLDRILHRYRISLPPSFLSLSDKKVASLDPDCPDAAPSFVALVQRMGLFFRELARLKKLPEGAVSKDYADRLRVKAENAAFLFELESKFGGRPVLEASHALKADVRREIQSGSLPLSEEPHAGQFETKIRILARPEGSGLALLDHPNPISPLPSREERTLYWETAKRPLRSEKGHEGVFLLANSQAKQDLVVKMSSYPYRELLASKICQLLGITTPEMIFVPRNSEEGKQIENVLDKSKTFCRSYKGSEFTGFLVMSRVYGMALEELDSTSALIAYRHYPSSLETVLENIGRIAALDVLLFYQDRLSHTGMSNLGNIMLAMDYHFIPHAVAIDQNVALSVSSVIMSPENKLKRVESIMKEFFSEDPSSLIDTIWEDMPASMKGQIDEGKAKACLHRGMQNGFRDIAEKISPSVLFAAQEECQSQFHSPLGPRDIVDLSHVIMAHDCIQKAVSSTV
jgi:hypothetical protein